MIVLWLTTGILAKPEAVVTPPDTPAPPGGGYLQPSGYYFKRRPRKEEVAEEQADAIEQAAEQVAAVAETYSYKITPAQLERMTAAYFRRNEPSAMSVEAIQAGLDRAREGLAALMAAQSARKEIERAAAEMTAMVAALAIIKQEIEDEELLLFAAS